jgi:beta-glucosidase
VHFEAGETKTVTFDLHVSLLSFYKDGAYIVEQGAFDVLVGPSSADHRLQSRLNVTEGDDVTAHRMFFSEVIVQ